MNRLRPTSARRVGLAVALAMLLAGCSSLVVDGHNLEGTGWTAVSVGGKLPPAGNEPTLRFESGAVRGYAGCNGFTGRGPASIVDGKPQLDEVLITLGGCVDSNGQTTAGGELEPAFMNALTSADHVAFRGEQLVLAGPDGELVFERQP